jgi:prephenate dehydrogenase
VAGTKIAIVGLGLVGRSIGLALSKDSADFELVGHDKDRAAASSARKMGAVGKTEWNLIKACEGAGVVVLALPPLAIRETMEAVAQFLEPGTLVLDTASLKAPVLEWADELLPAGVHFVGGDPVVGGMGQSADDASADLLQGALFCLCPSVRAAPDAVHMASDLVERLGAKPYFLDSAEHDGLMASAEHLPALLAAVLLASTTGSHSWRDMRRLAGSQYESGTLIASGTPDVLADSLLQNRQNIVHWIDAFIDSLEQWKTAIASGDSEQLEAGLEEAMLARTQWLRQKQNQDWDDDGRPQMPDPPGLAETMFGFAGRRSKKSRS